MTPTTDTSVTEEPAPDKARRRPSAGLRRRTDDRIVAGVAAGIGDSLGVDAAYVRAAFVTLAMASGLGIALYAVAWLLTSDRTADATDAPNKPLFQASTSERTRTVGAGLAFAGVVLLLAATPLWLGPLAGATALTSFGLATIWARSEEDQRTRWANLLLRTEEGEQSRREIMLRAMVGGGLVIVGLTVFFTTTDALRAVGTVALAALITGVGLLFVLGPWVLRLWQDLREERTDRIRAEEREELASHLHDSVLQTLALIQRTKDPEEQAILARIQERELRSWLFGSGPLDGAARLSDAVETMAGGIERDHQVAVETVTVGDADLDPGIEALVLAAREALLNAAKHSGTRAVSLYVEATDDQVEVFVTDQGVGFDPDVVEDDRHGVTDSIVARMERHGGTAVITSEPGEGVEVHLQIPRSNR